MRVRFYNIQWDTTDDNDEGESPSAADLGLPEEVTLDVDDDLCLETEGADVLSDRYGFCVFGFNFERETKHVHRNRSLPPQARG